MGFLTVNKSKDEVKDFNGTGGKFMYQKSGMYPVTIKHAIVDKTAKGSMHVNLVVDVDGTEQTIYQAYRLANNDGNPNKIGMERINKLMIVAGIDDIDDPTMVDLAIGKDKALKEYAVMEEFNDVEVILCVKRKFEIWDKGLSESLHIQNVFHPDSFASAAEIVNDGEAGKQYAIELETADRDMLAKDVTQEMVDAYLASKRSGGSSESASTPKDSKPKAPFSRFGAK